MGHLLRCLGTPPLDTQLLRYTHTNHSRSHDKLVLWNHTHYNYWRKKPAQFIVCSIKLVVIGIVAYDVQIASFVINFKL